MESYLQPLTSEIERRVKLSSELYHLLADKIASLEVTYDEAHDLEGDINQIWSCSVCYAKTGPVIYPDYHNSYGTLLKDPIVFSLYRRLTPTDDIDYVLDIIISETGTLRDSYMHTIHDSKNTDDMNDATLISTTKELTADEVQGLLNDIKLIDLKAINTGC